VAELLYLVHRIPYPPNKGDKIRSFHFLEHLSKRWNIHLGAFVDDPNDWRYAEELSKYCADVQLVPLNSLKAKVGSVGALFSGQALSVPYYYSDELAHWIEQRRREFRFDAVLVFSGAMAQYVIDDSWKTLPRVIDFVDVDSDKWRQYAESKGGIMRLVYQREAKKLLEFERKVAEAFDASMFVSEHERQMFSELAPESAEKILAVNNGVDLGRYDLRLNFQNPYAEGVEAIVFTGAMDYWANVDAVVWFAKEIWPHVHKSRPKAQFFIVGSNPAENVKSLGLMRGVVVTGAVDDVRPYLAHARVSVAPMRIARGVQNKVLEAMAMAIPVVTTPAGHEGIEAVEGQDLVVADSPEQFALEVLDLFSGMRRETVRLAGRKRIEADYTWEHTLQRLDAALEIVPKTARVAGGGI
jgi:sugar transferase (PEP-CTERM/EpsH1 system associated)